MNATEKSEIVWRSDDDWKARYSKLYSSRRLSQPVEDPTRRISFMGQVIPPTKSLLMRMRSQRDSAIYGEPLPFIESADITDVLLPQNRSFTSNANSLNAQDYNSSIDTLLLELVRAKSRENEESQDKHLELRDDVSEDQSSEACIHGLSMRMTDRSISRRSMSRISRVSTRRDMDIPSLMAFTATVPPPPHIRDRSEICRTLVRTLWGSENRRNNKNRHRGKRNPGSWTRCNLQLQSKLQVLRKAPLEIPAFQKINAPPDIPIPRWSIRRSTCPVCSQKWKDKSSITNIKYSGLKRNSSADLPTVIAPARLRSAITMEYYPRPTLAAVDENKYNGFMRNSRATWQLTRARRFRIPKLQRPPPEATAPPSSTAPMAQKDLDTRVNRFLTDEGMAKYLLEASFTL